MTAPNDYGLGLPSGTLDALFGFLERVGAREMAARYRALNRQSSADLAADFIERSFGASASGNARVGAAERVA